MIALWLAVALAAPIPEISAETLSGKQVLLPAAPPAKRTVLLLAFRQSQQADFDRWRPELARLTEGDGADWLELPFLDVPGLLKGIIGGAMNRGLKDPVTREHFAPVWASADPVKQALGIPSDDEMVLVVIDEAGEVRFRHDGPPTPEALASLEAAL